MLWCTDHPFPIPPYSEILSHLDNWTLLCEHIRQFSPEYYNRGTNSRSHPGLVIRPRAPITPSALCHPQPALKCARMPTGNCPTPALICRYSDDDDDVSGERQIQARATRPDYHHELSDTPTAIHL